MTKPWKFLKLLSACILIVGTASSVALGQGADEFESATGPQQLPLSARSVQPLPQVSQPCEYLSYSGAAGYYWRIPGGSGHDLYNMRFTPEAACTLKTATIRLYNGYEGFSDESGQGIDVIVWDDDGSGLPGTELARINVPASELVWDPEKLEVDFSENDLGFEGDFHIGWTVVNPAQDNMAILSDDGSNVWRVNPSQHTTGVPVAADIEVIFESVMDETSVDSSAFVIQGSCSGLHPGTFSFTAWLGKAEFVPDEAFYPGEKVTVTLVGDGGRRASLYDDGSWHFIADKSYTDYNFLIEAQVCYEDGNLPSSQGVPLDRSFTWSFTTAVAKSTGEFAPQEVYSVGDAPRSIVAADLTDDGYPDLATANFNPPYDVSVLFNQNDGTFELDSNYVVYWPNPSSICAADFNLDRDIDLAVTCYNTGVTFDPVVQMLPNAGGGTFGLGDMYWLSSAAVDPICIRAFDLNGDGYPDIAALTSARITIWLSTGHGGLGPRLSYSMGVDANEIAAGDFDNDGDIDLAVATFYYNPMVIVRWNDGSGGFEFSSSFLVGERPWAITAGDFNGDGHLDLATASNWGNAVSVLLNNGNQTFAAGVDYAVTKWLKSIAAADFDGDQDLDLVAANSVDDEVILLWNNGDGTFVTGSSFGTAYEPWSIAVSDVNGDGALDLAVANYGTNVISVLTNHAVVCVDSDGDGFGDPDHPENECPVDNCPTVYNPEQEDTDGDGLGDSCCCTGIRGNANSDPEDKANISDITFLIKYLFGIPSGPPPGCPAEGNANGDLEEKSNISDITYLINYLFGIPTGPEPKPCP